MVFSQPAKMPDKTSTRIDPAHLDQVLTDPKMRESYIRCLMDKGVCTPEASEVKHVLPSALNNRCASCSKRQKSSSQKIIQYLMDEDPDSWQKISAKYDPKGIHKKWYTPSPKKQDNPTTPVNQPAKNDPKKKN
ncbi:ejaculatory bulb-specific protein 3-like [Lycorma delicatula]|uniref:ejaculatory bulb-specific protein 3-like n=1 Tax=Lycorma delicatula TaxID=130591 RepID=UPI003F511EE9